MENKENLLDTIKKKAAAWNQSDDYPSCDEWREEGNKLLAFAKQEGQFNHYEHRLITDTVSQRDETFNELRAAYFLKKGCGVEITQWHPNAANKKRGEFIVCVNGINIFCEVKSPGWEGEIVNEQGNNSPRLKEPKVIHAETFGFNNASYIIKTVNKAYNKFPNTMPTLLIIMDDLRVDCFKDGLCIHRALYETPYMDNQLKGLFVGKDFEKLGGILFIQLELVVARGFLWKIHMAINENAVLDVSLPKQFIDILESVKQIDDNSIELYKIKNGLLEKF